jgi:hypothetical protein
MTSPLLRNLRTTLWSTLQKTSGNVRRTFQSDLLPCMLALTATCISVSSPIVALGQDASGRAVLSDPVNPLPPETVPLAIPQIESPRARASVTTAEAAGIRIPRQRTLSGPVPESSLQSTPVPRASVSTAEAAGLRNPSNNYLPRPAPVTSLPPVPVPRPSVSTAEAAGIRAPRTGASEKSWRQAQLDDVASSASQDSQTTESAAPEIGVSLPPVQEISVAGPDSIPLAGPDGITTDSANSLPPLTFEQPEEGPVVETWRDEYSSYIDQVLPGGQCQSSQECETVGAWWHRESERFIQQNREVASLRPEHVSNAAKAFAVDHTLPPERHYDVDVYDLNPIIVASQEVVAAEQPRVVDEVESKDSAEPGKNRLRTDIRKIRPTLSYAMRNIEPNQLPDGFNEKLDREEYVSRQTSPAVLQWAPTNLYHYPLYFEDPSLERYGHTYHPVVQPFASAGRFATQLVGLPYQMALHPVHAHEYTLGYYRPGECAPKKHYQIPFNEEAAFMQAAAIAGFILIFP